MALPEELAWLTATRGPIAAKRSAIAQLALTALQAPGGRVIQRSGEKFCRWCYPKTLLVAKYQYMLSLIHISEPTRPY